VSHNTERGCFIWIIVRGYLIIDKNRGRNGTVVKLCHQLAGAKT
jgi:hypothetical protein